MTRRTSFVGAVLLSACGPGTARDTQSTAAQTSGESGIDDNSESTSSSESSEETSTDSETGETSDCSDPDGDGDLLPAVAICDMLVQDCPEGEKCVPYASFGETWNDLRCIPVTGSGAAGEPCTTTGILSGQDDCDPISFCAGYDEDEVGGTCHPFCTGNYAAPECMDGWACQVPEAELLCHPPVYCVPDP